MGVLGIIAGAGDFPLHICDRAQALGDRCVVAGIEGAVHSRLENKAEVFKRFRLGDLTRMISFFKENKVEEAVFAGKVEHGKVLDPQSLSQEVLRILEGLPDMNPTTILKALIRYFSGQGIQIIQPIEFIEPLLCSPGVLSTAQPTAGIEGDIRFGWDKARRLADLDIGQTLIVKNGSVIAVEGMEGTDEAIRRAGRLAGGGAVVIKRGRTHQDLRIDLPAVGIQTIEAAAEAGISALCFEAGILPFFQKEEALKLAEHHGIVVIAR